MIRLLSSLTALVFALTASAQAHVFSCGTSGATGELLMPRLERNLRAMGDHPALGRTVSFVPVHFFWLRNPTATTVSWNRTFMNSFAH